MKSQNEEQSDMEKWVNLETCLSLLLCVCVCLKLKVMVMVQT